MGYIKVVLIIALLPCGSFTQEHTISKCVDSPGRICLNTTAQFGKTHFIKGYSHSYDNAETQSEKTVIAVNTQPFIIDGSSVHLIDASRHTQSFFTTVHDIASIILKCIEQGQKEISVAAFALTDSRIAQALIDAHRRGVNVCVITDKGKMKDRYSKIQKLINNGISVYWYDSSLRTGYKKKDWSDPLMHHKCMVIDGIVITGSANATKAAQFDNIENINILRDPLAVEEHRQEFIRLKKICVAEKKENKKR